MAEVSDFRVTSIAMSDTRVDLSVSLNINSAPYASTLVGTLRLYGYTNLTTPGAAIGTVTLSNGCATFHFIDTDSNKSYSAVIE